MKKILFVLVVMFLSLGFVSAQSDDDFFGGDDEFFFGGDDDFFFADDGIEELEDVSAKTDLSKGIVFDNGSVKIG